MSRELKFRVWDGGNMLSNHEINGDWILYGKYGSWSVMQFTGLKDKNGVEIYEGDILKFVGGPCHFLPAGIYQSDAHPIGTELVVRYLLSGFTLQRKECINTDIPNLASNVKQYDFWNNHSGLIVIGNIHQNPELLKP